MFEITERHWEIELVKRCTRGDRTAWTEFCGHYNPWLMHEFRALLGPGGFDLQLIEELVQELLAGLVSDNFEALRNYDPARSGLRTYLKSLAHRQIVLLRRKQNRHVREVPLGDCERAREDYDSLVEIMIDEFIERLSATRRRFVEAHLLGKPHPVNTKPLTLANVYKLTERVRHDCEEHMRRP
jgi:DNA-directed RNA polymerase specialized sigma24 family protein